MRFKVVAALRQTVWTSVMACGALLTAGVAQASAFQVAQSAPEASPPEAPAAASAGSKPPETVGTPATVIDGKAAESLLGKKVQSNTGEDLGRIVDVIVDKAGQIRAAVIDFGGFLGVGSRKIAVDWRSIRMAADGKLDHLIVGLPQEQLRSAPVYKEGEPVVVLGPAADQVKPLPAPPPAPTPAPSPAPAAPPPN